jgi:hypothetical protein
MYLKMQFDEVKILLNVIAVVITRFTKEGSRVCQDIKKRKSLTLSNPYLQEKNK